MHRILVISRLYPKSEDFNEAVSEHDIDNKNVTEKTNSENMTEFVAENDDAADDAVSDQPNIQDLASVLDNLNIVEPVGTISDDIYDLIDVDDLVGLDDLDGLCDQGIARSRKRKPKQKIKKPKMFQRNH